MDYTEDTYPFLIHKLMQYIQFVKNTEKHLSLIDIIVDFSLKNDVDIEVVGEAISLDVYFKSFIEKDCELHKIFRRKKDLKTLDEW